MDSFYWKASDPKTGFDFETGLKYNLPCTYSRKIMKIGTPLKVWGLTFLLVVLASIFLGMLVVTFNIWFRRGTGTILGILCLFFIISWIGFLYFLITNLHSLMGISRYRTCYGGWNRI